MAKAELSTLISWLKFFDIEYLDESLCEELALLDINNPRDRQRAIELAVIPEFSSYNKTSKASMIATLELSLSAQQADLKPLFERVGMPFPEPVASEHSLLKAVYELVIANAGPA